jgi:DNA-3-methyladenine glycosylase
LRRFFLCRKGGKATNPDGVAPGFTGAIFSFATNDHCQHSVDSEQELTRPTPLPGKLLPRAFFEDRPDLVAPRLLGKLLVHRTPFGLVAGRIVEVEAYMGPHNDPPDPAAHAHRGPTPRNQVLFGHAGHAYVYSIYGRYFCMNVSCERKGQAGSVLIRALEPIAGLEQMAHNRGIVWDGPLTDRLACQLTAGPGRLCQALAIVRATLNGLDLTNAASPFQIRSDGFLVPEALVTPRIGISEAVDWPLRFAIPGHPCVSGPGTLTGRRIFLG